MENIKLADKPWLPDDAILFLSYLVTLKSKVIETGSGGSTIWLARRCAELVSYENKRKYYNAVSKKLAGHDHVSVIHDPKYPERGPKFIPFRPDIALIDGRGRVQSIKIILPKMRPGGYIILDNAERDRYKPAIKMLNKYPKAIFRDRWTTIFWRV